MGETIRLDIAIQCGVNKLELNINGKDDLNFAIEALELMYKKVAVVTEQQVGVVESERV